MKIDSYYVSLKENGNADLMAKNGITDIKVCELENVSGLTAEQLEARAKGALKEYDFEVVAANDTSSYMQDQTIDLGLVRTKMRQILKDLSDENTSLQQKKEILDVCQQKCAAAQIIVNTCKLELQIDQFKSQTRKRK